MIPILTDKEKIDKYENVFKFLIGEFAEERVDISEPEEGFVKCPTYIIGCVKELKKKYMESKSKGCGE